jgi:hypothetical protein
LGPCRGYIRRAAGQAMSVCGQTYKSESVVRVALVEESPLLEATTQQCIVETQKDLAHVIVESQFVWGSSKSITNPNLTSNDFWHMTIFMCSLYRTTFHFLSTKKLVCPTVFYSRLQNTCISPKWNDIKQLTITWYLSTLCSWVNHSTWWRPYQEWPSISGRCIQTLCIEINVLVKKYFKIFYNTKSYYARNFLHGEKIGRPEWGADWLDQCLMLNAFSESYRICISSSEQLPWGLK